MGNENNIENEKIKEPDQIGYLGNIKSKYILEIILSHFQKKKILQILQYNKKIQKRLNYNFDDYKEFSRLYTEIEIDIIQVNKLYGKILNIDNKEQESYFHIYFNNSNEEIKQNYFDKKDKVSNIKIVIEPQVNSLYRLFENCKYIESINFKKFYRNNINNMSYMFYGCGNLKEIKFTSFNTENVINMSYMFSRCSSLKEVNLSHFNTNNVKDMH